MLCKTVRMHARNAVRGFCFFRQFKKKKKNENKKTKQMIATLINMYNLNMNLS